MPQERYQKLLLERAHARQRWENAIADEDSGTLDSEEVLRTVRIGVAAGRLPETLAGVDEALDRFGLRIGMKLTNASRGSVRKDFLAELPRVPTAHGAIPGLDQI